MRTEGWQPDEEEEVGQLWGSSEEEEVGQCSGSTVETCGAPRQHERRKIRMLRMFFTDWSRGSQERKDVISTYFRCGLLLAFSYTM